MKYDRPLLLLAAALLMLLSFGVAAAEETAADPAFAYRGITWATPAEVLAAAEGVEDVALFQMQGETYTGYLLQGVLEFNTPAVLSYYYKQEKLVAIWCSFMPMPAFDFAARLLQYTGIYGEPTEFDTLLPTALANAVIPGILDEDEILQIAGWELTDGTLVYLMNIDGNPEFICFNTETLLP